MTATTIRVQMAQRKDTAANWTAANPILLSGEIGYETDTKKFKIGNGSTAWNSLTYLPIPDGSGNLTITGNLEIGSTGSLTFEGSTADGFETTLAVTNPTADRTITLPDVTGTVVTTGDTGSVTSTMIANGTIVDADVSSTAEIAVSKLANGTANQVIVTDGTNVSWSDNLTLAGDLTVNGTTTTINTQDLLVEDKNIIIGNVATPSDVTADGGGITLKGATDKTINWVDATDAWTLSEHVNIASGKEYRIAGTKVLDATSLGSSVLITSANITDGTIVDGDISATAEIAVSKLADGTARQLLQTDAAGTGVEWASNIDIPGTLDVTGAAVFDSTTSTTGTSTAASFIPTSSTAPTNGLYLSGTNTVGISTGGTGRVWIDSNNRVGIGVGSPSKNLHIGPTDATLRLGTDTSSQYGDIYRDPADGLIKYNSAQTSPFCGHAFLTSGIEKARIRADGMFEVKGAGVAGSSPAFSVSGSAPANSLVIDTSGRLLVGTSSARGVASSVIFPLLVESANYAGFAAVTNRNDPDGCYIMLGKSRGATVGSSTIVQNNDLLGGFLFGGADGTDLESRAGSIICEVDGVPGVNDMPGRLVFSTTADGAASPTERMRISSNGTARFNTTAGENASVVISNNVASTYGLSIYDLANSGWIARFFDNASVIAGSITRSGSSVAYNTSSDYRLKENIVPLTGAIDRVNQLQVHRFNFIADPDKTVDGFIAHEAQAIVPECVTGIKDEVDDEGNPVYQGIDQSKLVPLLTAALQEAITKIETLEAKVAALEAQ